MSTDQKTSSMAAMLAASARQSEQSSANAGQNAQGGKSLGGRQQGPSGNIPARYEEALDVEGDIPINEVEVGGTVS
jgi:hypothetical protein